MEALPRQLNKREAKKTPQILELLNYTCVFEVKQTKSDTLPANSLKIHQYNALKKANNATFKYKIPDMGRYNPFDGFVLCKIPAVVIIIFGDDTRILININDFPPIDQKLTKKHALEIGRVI